jgi:TRAP transporter TAXI family solute receptor
MRFLKKSLAFILVLSMVAVSLASCGSGSATTTTTQGTASASTATRQADYSWGSAALGTATYVMIEAMASTANKYVGSKNSSVSTSGSVENLSLINQGEIAFGSGTSDSLYYGYNGMPPYTETMEFSQVFAFTSWSIPMLVRSDSGIENFEDLVGHTVSIGTSGQAASTMMLAIMDEYGIRDKIKYEYMSSADAADAFQAGQIDGLASPMILGKVLDTSMQQLSMSVDFKPVKVNKEILDRVVAKNIGLKELITSGSTFNVAVEDQYDIGNTAILICAPSLPEDDVYDIVKTLFEHSADLKVLSSRLEAFGSDYAYSGMIGDYPIHAGALRYYKEIGII